MSYSVVASAALGGGYTVVGLVQTLGSQNPPAVAAFQMLPSPVGHTTSLAINDGASIQFADPDQVVRAFSLITCASVCYTNSATGTSYVYHANAGVIGQASFNTAIGAIGAIAAAGPPLYPSVFVAVAHPGASDPGYQASVQALVGWGVPTNQVVEISNLFLPQFGLNNLLQLGY
jgi:hypothetical protein